MRSRNTRASIEEDAEPEAHDWLAIALDRIPKLIAKRLAHRLTKRLAIDAWIEAHEQRVEPRCPLAPM
jgi:hypothetical protein